MCGVNWKGTLVMQHQTGPTDWVIPKDRQGGWYPQNCNLNLDCFGSLSPTSATADLSGVHCTTGNFRAVMAIDGRWFYGRPRHVPA